MSDLKIENGILIFDDGALNLRFVEYVSNSTLAFHDIESPIVLNMTSGKTVPICPPPDSDWFDRIKNALVEINAKAQQK